MWNLRNKTEEHRGRGEKLNKMKSERETNHERLWTLRNTLRVSERKEVGIGGKRVMGIMEIASRSCNCLSPEDKECLRAATQ